MNMRSVQPSEAHLALRKAFETCIADHGKTLDAIEILAILSHMVGQVIAIQDQRKYGSEEVVELVWQNIETGNAEVVDRLARETGGTA